MYKNIFLSLFIFDSLIDLISVSFHLHIVHSFSKIMLMPLLIAYYCFSVSDRSIALVLALFFGWLGDLFLLKHMFSPEPDVFLKIGMGVFFLGHLFYIFTYRKLYLSKPLFIPSRVYKILTSIFIYIVSFSLILSVWNNLGKDGIIVFVYGTMIASMLISALWRLGYANLDSFWRIPVGALSFIISDIMIATNRFIYPFALAELFIMIGYIVGQYLIVRGVILHQNYLR